MELFIGSLIESKKTGEIWEVADVVFTEDRKVSVILIDDDGYPTWIRESYEKLKRDWKSVGRA